MKKLTLCYAKTFGTRFTSVGMENKFKHCIERLPQGMTSGVRTKWSRGSRKSHDALFNLFGEAQDNNLLIVFRLSLVPRQLNSTCSLTSPFHSDATWDESEMLSPAFATFDAKHFTPSCQRLATTGTKSCMLSFRNWVLHTWYAHTRHIPLHLII